jgi:hypothetical protein
MGVLAVLGGGRAQTQIVDPVEVNVPFEFHAGRVIYHVLGRGI